MKDDVLSVGLVILALSIERVCLLVEALGPLYRKLSFCILVLTARNLCTPVTYEPAVASGSRYSLSDTHTFGALNLEPHMVVPHHKGLESAKHIMRIPHDKK